MSTAELEFRLSTVTRPRGGPAVQDPQGYARDGLFWNPVFRIPVRISDWPLFLETHGRVLRG